MFAASLRESIVDPMLFRREVGRKIILQNKKGYPPQITLRGARMIAVVLLIVITLVLAYNAYLVWYAKSGRYDFDKRVDAYTKR